MEFANDLLMINKRDHFLVDRKVSIFRPT